MFQSLDKTKQQRGSVEIVLLIIVVAAIVGLVAWRIAETQRTQNATETAIRNNKTVVLPSDDSILVRPLNISFEKPSGYGNIDYANVKGGDTPSVQLVSERLKKSKYTCKGKNTGIFGALGVVQPNNGPQPKYTKKADDKTYGFTNGLTKACYSAQLLKDFREAVPKSIVESIAPLERKPDKTEAVKKEE